MSTPYVRTKAKRDSIHHQKSFAEHAEHTQWFQMAKIRHKIKLLVVISQTFPSKFQLISTISVSGDCVHLTFKTCKIVAWLNMTCQFHKFLNYFLADFFNLARSATGKKNLVNKGKQRQFPYLSLASKLDYNRFAVPDVILL